jgi:hypothetical protein
MLNLQFFGGVFLKNLLEQTGDASVCGNGIARRPIENTLP